MLCLAAGSYLARGWVSFLAELAVRWLSDLDSIPLEWPHPAGSGTCAEQTVPSAFSFAQARVRDTSASSLTTACRDPGYRN